MNLKQIIILLFLVLNAFSFEQKSVVDGDNIIKSMVDEVLDEYKKEKIFFPNDIFIVTEGQEREKNRFNPAVVQSYLETKIKSQNLFDFVGHNPIPIGEIYKTSTGEVKLKYIFFNKLKLESEKYGATKAFLWNINEMDGNLYLNVKLLDLPNGKVIWEKVVKRKYLKDTPEILLMANKIKNDLKKDLVAYLNSEINKTKVSLENNLNRIINKSVIKMGKELNQKLSLELRKNMEMIKKQLENKLDKKLAEKLKIINFQLDKKLAKNEISLKNNLKRQQIELKKELKAYIDKKYQYIKLKNMIDNYYISIGLIAANYSLIGVTDNKYKMMNGINLGFFNQSPLNIYYGFEFEYLARLINSDNDIVSGGGAFVMGFGNISQNHFGLKTGIEVMMKSGHKGVSRSALVFKPFYNLALSKNIHTEINGALKIGNNNKLITKRKTVEGVIEVIFKYTFKIGR